MSLCCNLNNLEEQQMKSNSFVAVQESACPVGDEEEAGGGSVAVHTEGGDADCGSSPGQTSLGEGFQ